MSRSEDSVRLEHGSGGALSRELVERLLYPALRNAAYPELLDATTVEGAAAIAVTTDGYVVDPPFFPGGDIGKLAVYGTCNDLSVAGAQPLYLAAALILEEGLEMDTLRRAMQSLAAAAREIGVAVVTGDTKVVPAGKGGGIYVTTTGIGRRVFRHPLVPAALRAGDTVIVSGPIGAHGIAVLAAREELSVASGIRSDCASLWPLCRQLYEAGPELRFLRDATRGGVAAVLNEMVAGLEVGIEIREEAIPVREDVRMVSEVLGLNPLEIANEGVLVAVLAPEAAERALAMLRAHELGRQACAVGTVTSAVPGQVVMRTRIGGTRLVDLPRGLLLPRIC